MWIFCKAGFFSIVEDREDSSRLLIRARFEEDVEHICELIAEATEGDGEDWEETPDADYRYRVFCDRDVFMDVASELVGDIDYDNFKAAVPGDPVRAQAYTDCWAILKRAQGK